MSTAGFVAAVQQADGAIPWEPGRHVDPWNHGEAAMGLTVAGHHEAARAAYDWLAHAQNADGSWYAGYRDGTIADSAVDLNFTAYIAVGVRHFALSTTDRSTARRWWPAVEGALDFVTGHQRDGGEFPWRTGDEGAALLAGNCSIAHALANGLALAEELGHPKPGWRRARERALAAITGRPEAFEPKPHAMDWYYPVLCGARDRLADRWDEFVVPGLGVRCEHTQPWVTGGETAELALVLAARGDSRGARELLAALDRLRCDDGSYWTGYQFENDDLWPLERTTWTAGAVLLASAAVDGDPATTAVFGGGEVTRGAG